VTADWMQCKLQARRSQDLLFSIAKDFTFYTTLSSQICKGFITHFLKFEKTKLFKRHAMLILKFGNNSRVLFGDKDSASLSPKTDRRVLYAQIAL